MSTSPTRRVARNLRKLRAARDLTQEQLADLTGVAAAQISRIETGARNTTLATLEALSTGLGCSLVELVGTSRPAQPVAESETATVIARYGALGAVERAAVLELMRALA